MKKLGVLLAVVVVVGALSGIAGAAERSFVVNPLGLLFGAINGEYESALAGSNSLVLGGSYLGGFFQDVSLNAIGGRLGMRQYLSGDERLEGFYFGGYASVATLSASDSYSSANITALGAGAEAGFKWIWDNGFTLQLGGGLATPLLANATDGETNVTETGVALGTTLSLAIGYSW